MEEMEKKKQELKDLFDGMDEDKGGSINVLELAKYLKSLGTLPDQIKEIMKEADSDGSGTMDFEEFYELMTTFVQTKNVDTLDDFLDVFKLFDRNSNGLIKLSDIKKVIQTYDMNVTDEEIDDLFSMCDIQDGIINYKKYINFMLDK